MKLHDVKQGTKSWLRLRLGVVTASMAHTIVTPSRLSAGKADAYLNTLLVEMLLGKPADETSSGWMDRGTDLEPKARAWLAAELDVDVDEVGFITSDCGRFGCSPDGVIAEAVGVEIKCRSAVKHVACLRDPEAFDAEVRMQTQFGLWVTGWPKWLGVAFNPVLPNLLREYEPDPDVQAALDEHMPAFRDRLDSELARLRAMLPEPDDTNPFDWD